MSTTQQVYNTLSPRQLTMPLFLCRRVLGRLVFLFRIKYTECMFRDSYKLVISPIYGLTFLKKENIPPFLEMHSSNALDVFDFKTHEREWGTISWNAFPYRIMDLQSSEKRGCSTVIKRPIFFAKKNADCQPRLMVLHTYTTSHKTDCSEQSRVLCARYLDMGGGIDYIKQEHLVDLTDKVVFNELCKNEVNINE